ncbi:hypothetical protein CFP56_015956 [Quercus suber]|uniref:RNase H type-1 domain-containing protein n=1 Tax=Quercus suber TaxID=58331 RepID=A0AAW0KQD7_QUESU
MNRTNVAAVNRAMVVVNGAMTNEYCSNASSSFGHGFLRVEFGSDCDFNPPFSLCYLIFFAMGVARRTILRNAMHLVEEFWTANKAKTENQAEPVPLVSWQPPPQGYYKVNIDGTAGVGVIIRDGTREVIVSKKWKCPLGSIEVEAKALEAEVNFARDVGIREAEFESDSLLVCNACKD